MVPFVAPKMLFASEFTIEVPNPVRTDIPVLMARGVCAGNFIAKGLRFLGIRSNSLVERNANIVRQEMLAFGWRRGDIKTGTRGEIFNRCS